MLAYDVVAVGSGEEAGLLPHDPGFDVLLTDMMLPGCAGSDLARGLLERWPTLKVILMSGYTEDEAVRRGALAGRLRFLQKPFDMATLAREIRGALEE
jgi:DNA-binding response OmpR family regulator